MLLWLFLLLYWFRSPWIPWSSVTAYWGSHQWMFKSCDLVRDLLHFVFVKSSPRTGRVIRLCEHPSVILSLVLKVSDTLTNLTDIFCFGEETNWVRESKEVSRWLLWLFILSCSSSGVTCRRTCCTWSRWCIWCCNIIVESLKSDMTAEVG